MDSGAESPLREVSHSENAESVRAVVKVWIFFDRFADDSGTISAYMVSLIRKSVLMNVFVPVLPFPQGQPASPG